MIAREGADIRESDTGHLRRSDLFFIALCSFIVGTVWGGVGLSLVSAGVATCIGLIGGRVMRISATALVYAACFFLAGAAVYAIDDYAYHEARESIVNISSFEGIVKDEPRRTARSQLARIAVTNSDARSGGAAPVVLATLEPYPQLRYGDRVRVRAAIEPIPRDEYGAYLAKERIHGMIRFPSSIEVFDSDPSPFFSGLYRIREAIKGTIGALFSYQHAAFLSGILLGERDEFSPEFLDKLSFSGTMHLSALSGLNVAIIVFIASAVFSAVLQGRRGQVFAATFIAIALFVAMTGFMVSAVRASLMAFCASAAGMAGRLSNPRNAIALAAVIITLHNPKAPVHDIAFQLSFAATVSIIYLAPAFQRLSFFQKEGFLSWRSILAITLTAQAGVTPISIMHFSNFSFSSLPANIAILAPMSLLMALAIAAVAASFVFLPLAQLLAVPTAFLVDYSLSVIDIFSAARMPFNPEIGFAAVAIYYAVLIWIAVRFTPHPADSTTVSAEVLHVYR